LMSLAEDELKKALIVFNYAERLKAGLIIAWSLLGVLSETKEGAELAGAEKVLVAYFNALISEVNIAANASKVEGFRGIAASLEEVINCVRRRDPDAAQRLIAEAISMATTQGDWAAHKLAERDLI